MADRCQRRACNPSQHGRRRLPRPSPLTSRLGPDGRHGVDQFDLQDAFSANSARSESWNVSNTNSTAEGPDTLSEADAYSFYDIGNNSLSGSSSTESDSYEVSDWEYASESVTNSGKGKGTAKHSPGTRLISDRYTHFVLIGEGIDAPFSPTGGVSSMGTENRNRPLMPALSAWE